MRALIRLGKVQETREGFLEDCLQKKRIALYDQDICHSW